MTVPYLKFVSTARVGAFTRIFFLWRGSVWRSIHPELFTWLACYLAISCTYRWVLRGTPGGRIFESVITHMDTYLGIAASSTNFVIGFYVTYIATRWWWVFHQIPWPDNFYSLLSAFFQSKGEKDKKFEHNLRMSINRYWNVSFILLLRDISESARKRFPTLEHLVPALLTEEEVALLEKAGADDPHLQGTCLFFLPMEWTHKLLKKAHERGNICSLSYTILVKELMKTREGLNNLLSQDFLSSVPLSYSQVAFLVPSIYFFLSLIGRQFVQTNNSSLLQQVDYYVPFYSLYEFVIYFGWLKVAQYGNLLLDRMFDQSPKLAEVEVGVIPHTKASAFLLNRCNPMLGSIAGHEMEKMEQEKDYGSTIRASIHPLDPPGEFKGGSSIRPLPAVPSPLPQPPAPQPAPTPLTRRPSVVTVEFGSPNVAPAGEPKTEGFDEKPTPGTQKKDVKPEGVLKTDPTQRETWKE